jgi:hypothetical protein
MKPKYRAAVLAAHNTTGDVVTDYLDLTGVNLPVELLCIIGAVTADDTVVTLDESTGSDSTTAVAIGFSYRFTDAVTGDTAYGSVTTCDSAGMTIAADSADNKVLILHVGAENVDEGYRYIHFDFATGGSTSSFDMGAIWVIEEPRYATLDTTSDT